MNPESAAGLRWGVLGAARILRKLVPALRAAGGQVVAIGASTEQRAWDAAAVHDIPTVHESYGDVLRDPHVDAVYLPLANSLHKRWLLATADAGRHCLCEKPLVLSAADARDVRDRFRAAGRRLQEGFLWMHHPQAAWARARFRDGDLGVPRRIHATFSFPLDRPDDYRWKRAMGGGALWDLGCYCVSAARHFLGAEPVAVSARARFRAGDDGVDETAAAWMDFGDGRSAAISCSFVSAFAQSVEIVGTQGRARIDRPWMAAGGVTRVDVERGYDREAQEFEEADAYRRMVEHFTTLVRNPTAAMWPAEDGVDQARAMEALVASAAAGGVVTDPGPYAD